MSPSTLRDSSGVTFMLCAVWACLPTWSRISWFELPRATKSQFAPGSLQWKSFMASPRSEEHTSELQSRSDLVCRLLLEKKNRGEGEERDGAEPRLRRGEHGVR